MNQALLSNVALSVTLDSQQRFAEAAAAQLDLSAIADLIRSYPFDFGRLRTPLVVWLPPNLQDQVDLAEVAKLTLDEGIPLSWVPRADIVEELVTAEGSEVRWAVLEARMVDILDDCEAVLAEEQHEWARQCRTAIGALRSGNEGSAQSHAANIIDSILRRWGGNGGPDDARDRARNPLDDLSMELLAEQLTIRPLARAFGHAKPGKPVVTFKRHATAHQVGYQGVFSKRHALVAVMLATSLTVEYGGLLDPGFEEETAGP